eukprot:TRINITY_DN12136_c0_g3_i1.p1 TRINITY_DN12136_c0_g3~~TRINITY_DN12136_c0_g3_i1.p1  ORF type:complete len:233 (+),score=38.01 TRINITY_DN12136_c0_g3_i1:124-822(+)
MVGDSITYGVCASNRASTSYPAQLQKILGSSYQVTNFGNSGKTMLKQGLSAGSNGTYTDASYWDTPQYPTALASRPDIVTILLGTNDAKQFNWFGVQAKGDSYASDYANMVATFKALYPPPKIVIGIPPPLYPPYPYDMNRTVINEELPALLRDLQSKLGVDAIADTFTALGGANQSQPGITCKARHCRRWMRSFDVYSRCHCFVYVGDGCHPVDKGYAEMAKVFASVIRSL